MFGLVYVYNNQMPNIRKVSFSRLSLWNLMEEEAINYVYDSIGKNNWINTLKLETLDEEIQFPIYPNYSIRKVSENELVVNKITKVKVTTSGWIKNYSEEKIVSEKVASFYCVAVDQYEITTLKTIIHEPIVAFTPMIRCNGFDKVIEELKAKLSKEDRASKYIEGKSLYVKDNLSY